MDSLQLGHGVAIIIIIITDICKAHDDLHLRKHAAPAYKDSETTITSPCPKVPHWRQSTTPNLLHIDGPQTVKLLLPYDVLVHETENWQRLTAHSQALMGVQFIQLMFCFQ